MTITINTAHRIDIDGHSTGLALSQERDRTVIYTPTGAGTEYKEHAMPHLRYSSAHDAPSSGAAGRLTLEADVKDLLARLQ
jgi:hypothetical protein